MTIPVFLNARDLPKGLLGLRGLFRFGGFRSGSSFRLRSFCCLRCGFGLGGICLGLGGLLLRQRRKHLTVHGDQLTGAGTGAQTAADADVIVDLGQEVLDDDGALSGTGLLTELTTDTAVVAG